MNERVEVQRTNGIITVTLPAIVGDVWKDWRTAHQEALRFLKVGEYAARSHEDGRTFTFIVDGGVRACMADTLADPDHPDFQEQWR